MRPRVASALWLWVVLGSGLARAATPPADPERPRVVEVLYQGGLQNGWKDFGWSPRTLGQGAAQLNLSNFGGWILGKPGRRATYGGLLFRLAGAPAGSFSVRLEGMGKFEKVLPGASERLGDAGGFTEYFVAFSQLNPDGRPFDQVVFEGAKKGDLKSVRVDGVGLTEFGDTSTVDSAARGGPRLEVDCTAPATPISPWIYGVAFDVQKHDADDAVTLGATVRRWGGNNSSRYNWKLGNAWNTGSDYYFMNVDYVGAAGWSWKSFLAQQSKWGLKTVLSLPTLGQVAKDTRSVSFPVAELPNQQQIDPERKQAGNGLTLSGSPIASPAPTRTSVPASPDFIAEWVKAVEADPGAGSMLLYILDNEPGLWNSTHRDVHPEPLSYDELWRRTVDYGTAVKRANPKALVAGPAEWGWPGYFDSAVDLAAAASGRGTKADRRAHGNQPIVEWWLDQLAAHEKKTGQRLVDVLDLHYYPQAKGVGHSSLGSIDPATNALRLRSTRSLWDPTYLDESWLSETINLIPRMKGWVAAHAPGVKLMLGEYSFGAEAHPSGALAQAEALGRFGQLGVYAAFAWVYPPKDSAAGQAFRAFRNYDGKGAHFLDLSVPTTSSAGLSLFASKSADGKKLVLVALNLDPDRAALAPLTLKGCGKTQQVRVFQTVFGPNGLEPLPARGVKVLPLRPYSVTVAELELTPPN